MKKTFLLQLLLLLVPFMAIAQDFTAYGVVTTAGTNFPVPNHTVYVASDSTVPPFFNFHGQTQTDSTGSYSIVIPGGAQVGPNIMFKVFTYDCQNFMHHQWVENAQGSITQMQANFAICYNPPTNCTADFNYNIAQDSVTFTFSSFSTPALQVAAYHWNVNGHQSSNSNFTYTFPGPGIYGACLTLSYTNGCTATMCDTIYVLQNPPASGCSANFTVNINGGGTFTFNAASPSNYNPFTWNWNMGDGTTKSGQTVTHQYTTAGPHIVTLVVTDSTGCVDSSHHTINWNPPTNCNAHFKYTINSDLLTFNFNSGSSAGINQTVWNINGLTINGSTATYTFPGPGKYSVCLSKVYSNGCSASICDTVIAGPNQPSGGCNAAFGFTNLGGGNFNFSAAKGSNYGPVQYKWQFNDGSPSKFGPIVNHQFLHPGAYQVRLIVIDGMGCIDSMGMKWVAWGPPCNIAFNYHNPLGSSAVSFYLNGDYPAGSQLVWYFGDGHSSNSLNPIHNYQAPGTYSVSVNIVGGGCHFSTNIVVSGGNTVICNTNFHYVVKPNQDVQFHGLSTSLTSTNPVTWHWDFGDGDTSSLKSPLHQYASGGSYIVCLTATDANNCTNTFCDSITVGVQNALFSISGYANVPTGIMNECQVYLIVLNNGILTAVDSVTTTNGAYIFTNVPHGIYLLKAALLPSAPHYSIFLPTYYHHSYYWFDATPLMVHTNLTGIDIHVIQGNNPGGPGFISGSVVQGANKKGGTTLSDIPVLLLDLNDNPIAYTYSDANGNFSFDDIAYGTYQVFAELPNRITYPAIVYIGSELESVTDVRIDVYETEILSSLTSVKGSSANLDFKAYPNPASDKLFVKLSDVSGEAEVTITDIAGRIIYAEKTNEQLLKLDVEQFDSGIYLLSVKSATANGTTRIVITR